MAKYVLSDEQKERIEQNRWLTDRERLIFELRYRRGMTIEDIAADLEFDRRTVDRVLRRLRKLSH